MLNQSRSYTKLSKQLDYLKFKLLVDKLTGGVSVKNDNLKYSKPYLWGPYEFTSRKNLTTSIKPRNSDNFKSS